MADAPDLGSGGVAREGSTPSSRTIPQQETGMQEPPAPLRQGERLGRYEILAPLGAGGMGEVYRARDTSLRRDVAIKVLGRLAGDAEARKRFQREAQAVAALSHPNVVAVYDVAADATP